MHFQHVAARHNSNAAAHLLLIHGWGISSKIWLPSINALSESFNLTLVDLPGFGLSEAVDQLELNGLLAEMAEAMPDQFSVMGFSLGGMLAVQLAEQYPKRVEKVITIAANVKFVESEQWPHAMGGETYQQFYQTTEKSPAVILKRFLLLQAKGANDEKGLLKQLRELSDSNIPEAKTLLSSLDLLTAINNQQAIEELKKPLMCVFGEQDQLVPKKAAEVFSQLTKNIQIIKGASHAPHVSHSKFVGEKIVAFLKSDQQGDLQKKACPKKLNKRKVAESFARAAETYDDVAGLQRDVGEQLEKILPSLLVADDKPVVMDLGCGTGYFLPQLEQKLKPEQLLALDLAEGMLQYSREHRQLQQANWLCGDAEAIPLADNTVDVIFSSLAIQWCENSEQLFSEIYRVLKPGGQFIVSTLGPNTLHELRRSWQAVDDYVHVNQFLPEHEIKAAITESGLKIGQWQQQDIVLKYEKLTDLTRELKHLGAHNVNAGRPTGLMGKKRIKAFRKAYEEQRNQLGFLPATYEVWYAVLEKPLV